MDQAQTLQQQIQNILIQKEGLNLQLLEIKKALEEIEKAGQTEFYKIAGPVLIKTEPEQLKAELREKQNAIQERLDMLARSEARIKSKIEQLGSKSKRI